METRQSYWDYLGSLFMRAGVEGIIEERFLGTEGIQVSS
jgi:hypothetical protein